MKKAGFTADELNALRDKAYRLLSEKRIPHVTGCEEEAVRMAERWGEESSLAAAAGILHDCTKKLAYEEQLQLIRKYDILCEDDLLNSPKLLHAVTGAAVAKHEFAMPEAVVSAIRWHTTGKAGMTLLEKIIYLADYIEPTRCFDGLDELRSLAYEDIDAAMALGLKMSVADVTARGNVPHSDSLAAYDYFLNLTHS